MATVKLLEYPRPALLNGEALREQLCIALDLDADQVSAGLSGDTLQIGVPKGTDRRRVERVLASHDGERASEAWLRRRGLA